MSGATYEYNDETGVVSLSNPTANVTITATCPAEPEPEPTTYTVTTTVTNGSYSGDNSITEGSTASVTISADNGYELPSAVEVSGASYTYDDTTGVIALSEPTGNVTISATCPAEETPSSLSPIAVSDTLTAIKFDTSLTAAEVVDILATLTYDEDGACVLVSDSNIGGDGIVYCYAFEDNSKQYYNITVMTDYDEQDGATEVSVFTDNTVHDGTGWEIQTDTVPLTITPTVTAVDQTAGWNGVVVGK